MTKKVVALTYDWRDEDGPLAPSSHDLAMLKGEVVSATYNVSRDALVLVYADERIVTVTLHQCKSHACDETCMVVEG